MTATTVAAVRARDAAREASDGRVAPAGAGALLEAVLPYADRFDDVERARLSDEYAWELYNAHRFEAAVAAGARRPSSATSSSVNR